MSDKIEKKREAKAKSFITAAKEAFQQFIPRDTIGEITVTECAENAGTYAMLGSVSTLSPTGKSKTFKYTATVNEDADGKCTLADLKVSEL